MILYGSFGFGYYSDYTYILVIAAFALTAFASFRVRSVYAKYAKVSSASGYTGASAAQLFLERNMLYSTIRLTSSQGTLSDHFDPRNATVRLSDENFYGSSIAAVAVAAHECGHVLQYRDNYLPFKLRGAMVPVVNFAATLAWPIFVLGMVVSSFDVLIPLGILLFGASVAFHIVTLPVELDASGRAMKLLKENYILQDSELKKARAVLNAAAFTYIAAAMGSLLQLLRLILIAKRYDRD